MSKLILAGLDIGSTNYYGRIVDESGLFRRGDNGVFEAYSAANISLYGADVGSETPYYNATEIGNTDAYTITVPSLNAGAYSILFYEQTGTLPTEGDPYVGGGSINWDGSGIVDTSDIAQEVWEYHTRTLTMTQIAIQGSLISGSDLSVRRGDTLSIAMTSLGALTGYDNIWFTVKTDRCDEDSDSILQMDSDTGILYLNKATPTATQTGTIVVDDAVSGNLTITISATASKGLPLVNDAYWDIQKIDGDVVNTLATGLIDITWDITKRIA